MYMEQKIILRIVRVVIYPVEKVDYQYNFSQAPSAYAHSRVMISMPKIMKVTFLLHLLDGS